MKKINSISDRADGVVCIITGDENKMLFWK
jgi:hypothetical protein